jgi:hypothetical protein
VVRGTLERDRPCGSRRRRAAIVAFLVAGVLGCTSHPPLRRESGDAVADPPSETRLDLRVAPLVDLYYLVRRRAAGPSEAPVEPGFTAAVAAARRVQEFFGSFGGWGPVDTLFLAAENPGEVRERAARLPEPVRLRDGREIALRGPLLELVAAIEDAEPTFLEGHWPIRRETLARAVRDLERDFLPRHRQALAFMLRSLAIADPGIEAPVFLVSEASPPGAFTFHLRGGAPACVVSIEGGVETVLFETMLHEATHVLDMASSDDSSVFVTLRSMLEQVGVPPGDRRVHDVPHTLMFVQAGETVRRFYDPRHVDYGEVTTLYARSEPIASIEREVWRAHLGGEIDRDEALRRIVDRTVAAATDAAER